MNPSASRTTITTGDNDETEGPLFYQRLNNALDGLEPYFMDHVKNKVSKTNALTIADYVLAMRVETNLSTNHRRGVITTLKLLSGYLEKRPFRKMTREDILSFLDSVRKPETWSKLPMLIMGNLNYGRLLRPYAFR